MPKTRSCCSNIYQLPTLTLTVVLVIAFFQVDWCTKPVGADVVVNNSQSQNPTSPFHNLSCEDSKDCFDTNKECLSGRCVCKAHFDEIAFHTENGINAHPNTCRKTFGASCSSFPNEEILCNPHKLLKCSDKPVGVCLCFEDESPLVYDYYLDTCAARPGDKCDLIKLPDHSIRCVRNAECVEAEWSGEHALYYGVCQCSRGYVEYGENKRCVPKLGSKCLFASDCNYDESMGMECLRGRCSCSNGTLYDKKEHQCRLKVGQICEVDKENCVERARCDYSENKGELRCMCNEDHHETENGTCISDEFSLYCGNKSDDLVMFDEVKGRCSIKVGGPCKTNGRNRCVSHAFCGAKNKCQCFEGYSVTMSKTCEELEEVTTTSEVPAIKGDASPAASLLYSGANVVNIKVDLVIQLLMLISMLILI